MSNFRAPAISPLMIALPASSVCRSLPTFVTCRAECRVAYMRAWMPSAVSPEAAEHMGRSEMYSTAVHNIGHRFGLKHNANCRSVMYFLNVNGSEALDRKDILELRNHHQLRPAIAATGFRPIQVIQSDIASKRPELSTVRLSTDRANTRAGMAISQPRRTRAGASSAAWAGQHAGSTAKLSWANDRQLTPIRSS